MLSLSKSSQKGRPFACLLTAIMLLTIMSANAVSALKGEPYKHQHLHAVKDLTRREAKGQSHATPLQVTHIEVLRMWHTMSGMSELEQ